MLTVDYERVGFDDFTVGDEIRFVTNDNGFGGAGLVWRTGTVKHRTAKALTVACPPGQLGRTARIRRADWSNRSPQRPA